MAEFPPVINSPGDYFKFEPLRQQNASIAPIRHYDDLGRPNFFYPPPIESGGRLPPKTSPGEITRKEKKWLDSARPPAKPILPIGYSERPHMSNDNYNRCAWFAKQYNQTSGYAYPGQWNFLHQSRRTLGPSESGNAANHLAVPKVPHREASVPKVPHREASVPKGPHREASVPKVPHREASVPKVPHREASVPKVPHREASVPKVPHRESGVTEEWPSSHFRKSHITRPQQAAACELAVWNGSERLQDREFVSTVAAYDALLAARNGRTWNTGHVKSGQRLASEVAIHAEDTCPVSVSSSISTGSQRARNVGVDSVHSAVEESNAKGRESSLSLVAGPDLTPEHYSTEKHHHWLLPPDLKDQAAFSRCPQDIVRESQTVERVQSLESKAVDGQDDSVFELKNAPEKELITPWLSANRANDFFKNDKKFNGAPSQRGNQFSNQTALDFLNLLHSQPLNQVASAEMPGSKGRTEEMRISSTGEIAGDRLKLRPLAPAIDERYNFDDLTENPALAKQVSDFLPKGSSSENSSIQQRKERAAKLRQQIASDSFEKLLETHRERRLITEEGMNRKLTSHVPRHFDPTEKLVKRRLLESDES